MHWHKRTKRICCEYGCYEARWNYGRCHPHAHALPEAERKRLKNLSVAERNKEYFKRLTPPEMPRWEWLGDEAELAAIFGGNDN